MNAKGDKAAEYRSDPKAVRIVAHAVAPPNEVLATAGPSTTNAAKSMLVNALSTTIAQTQLRERNSGPPTEKIVEE